MKYTAKTVFFNQKNIPLIYGQRKNFFELKKVLLIQKNGLWSKEIDLFTLKKILLNEQNFLQFKEIFWYLNESYIWIQSFDWYKYTNWLKLYLQYKPLFPFFHEKNLFFFFLNPLPYDGIIKWIWKVENRKMKIRI